MDLVPLEDQIEAGKEFVNGHLLETGNLLPLTEKQFGEYFPKEQTFLLFKMKSPTGILSYRSGRDKQAPIAWFRVLADALPSLRQLVKLSEETALAEEKLYLRTTVLGYDSKKLAALKSLGYKQGASIPGAVSLAGTRYDYITLNKQLTDEYRFNAKREYAKPGLYPIIEVQKPDNASLTIRGYRREDRPFIDSFATHNNVMRGIGSGVFAELYPWIPGSFDQMVESGRMVPLVCEDRTTGRPVGTLDLTRHLPQVMRHTAMLGMFVKAEFQRMGVGTMLMESMTTLARRLHLARVWLSVFEGNAPAQRLYKKSGFEDSGSMPGWLQEGYVNEIFMTLRLD